MTAPSSHVRFPKRTTGEIALGGVCWILTLEFFAGQVVAQMAWRTPYSLIDNPISDLGSTSCQYRLGVHDTYICSPWYIVMNVSFILTGALFLLGLYFTRYAWPRRRLTTWGFVFICLAGLGKIVVGFAPENVNHVLHDFGGLGIVWGNIGMVLLGFAIWQARRWAAGLSLLLGGLGLVGVLLFFGATHGQALGAAERLADYPVILWMVALGSAFLVWRRESLRQTKMGAN